MNKVLITGMEIGNEIGLCGGCSSLDFTWLLNKPSILMWADKISITDIALRKILNNSNTKIDKSIKLILEIAEANNLLDIVTIDEKLKGEISKNTEIVENEVVKEYIIKGNNTEDIKFIKDIQIGEFEYCLPYVVSLYRELEMAKIIGANCLFNEKDLNYMKNRKISNNKYDMIGEIFKIYFPNDIILHNYLFEEENNCHKCRNFSNCSDIYLKEIEKNTQEILKWRDYDEICSAKHEIDKIIKMKDKIGVDYNIEDVKKEFLIKQKEINKNMKKVFPKIKRWTELVTIFSLPVTICSAATDNPKITIASATTQAIAKGIESVLNYYENKNNWVGFINKNVKT